MNRRDFLADLGMGFSGLAMGALLHQDGIVRASDDAHAAWTPPDGKPHHTPKAKSVIWVFLSGGYSHMETFDPKPALTKYAGKSFDQTPFENPTHSPLHKKRSRSVVAEEINVRDNYTLIYPMQIGFRKHGQSGIEVTDWWPHLATCVDDIAFVRNMYTTDNDHAAENQMHTGRHRLDEIQPSIGAWVQYGLGSLSDNLPQFVVLGPSRTDNRPSIGSYYLGPQYAGVPLAIGSADPLPNSRRAADVLAAEQANEFSLINQLNNLNRSRRPYDSALEARIRSYELAFRMQTAVPDALNLSGGETAETRRLYGIDQDATRAAGERLLGARRLVERGVRFIQVYASNYGAWDSHRRLKGNHELLCNQVDKPIAGLLKDLKRRGLWDDVVVAFCTEFGRTPGLEQRDGGRDGRDHHPHGFTVWFAGAGIKKGYVHGATDELGFHAIEPGHYVTDMHATVLHLLGLNGRRLEVPGRRRLAIDHGQPITDILI